MNSGVAKMPKNLRTSKGDYWIKQWIYSIASLFEMGTCFKGKNLLPEGAIFFLLRAVPYTMENHFYHIRWPPLNVTICITHVRNCVMGATPVMNQQQQNQRLRTDSSQSHCTRAFIFSSERSSKTLIKHWCSAVWSAPLFIATCSCCIILATWLI